MQDRTLQSPALWMTVVHSETTFRVWQPGQILVSRLAEQRQMMRVKHGLRRS